LIDRVNKILDEVTDNLCREFAKEAMNAALDQSGNDARLMAALKNDVTVKLKRRLKEELRKRL